MPDPQMIGPYRLERVLGTGSFATVWLARDDVLDRHVAVKILADNWSRDNEVRRRFLAEARVLLTVESPRIVRGFHLGEAPTGQPYLVMAWADRGTLGDRLEQRRSEGRTFDTYEVVGIATEVAYALVDVHGSGHLHRDVKPTNVLIRSSSTRRSTPGLAADETVVLADFGLARGLDLSSLTLVAGSPGYVAPEQAAGLTQLDRRADLYSLGRIMLELLTGDPGGRATTMAGAAAEKIDVSALVDAMQEKGVRAPSSELVDLIQRLVAEDPAARPSSAEEVAADLSVIAGSLRTAAGGGPAGETARPLAPPSAPPVVEPAGSGARLTGTQLAAPAPRSPTTPLRDRRVIVAAAVLLAGIVAVVLALTGGDGDPNTTTGTTTTSAAPVVDTSEQGATSAPVEPTESVRSDSDTTDLGRPKSDGGRDTADSGATDDASISAEPTETAASSAPADPATTVLDEPAEPTGPTTTGWGQLPGQLALPRLVHVEGKLNDDLDPERQVGTTILPPQEFVADLVELNSAWTGDPGEPDAEGSIRFEIRGPDVTATVIVSVLALTTGDDIVISGFEIEYQ